MKKIKIIAAILLTLLIIPFITPAIYTLSETKVYYISGYNINVDIKNDGTGYMEERLTYSFQGHFNGVFRNIDFSETSGIKDISVFVDRNGTLSEIVLNSDKNLDASGSSGTYNCKIEGKLAKLKIFETSDNEEKTFVIKYRLLEAATRYNDTAEFNRRLIDTEWQTRIDNIAINITLPEGASKEEIKIFGHGPLTGSNRIIDERNVEFIVPSLSPGTFVETLVLFPNKLVPLDKKIIIKDALPGIMENERNLAEEANKTREEARNQVQLEERKKENQNKLASKGIVIAFLMFLLWFPVIIYIYIKYDRELKHSFEGKYYRELPGEYTPAEMSVLMTFGSVGTRDIMATIMDLVRKGVFTLKNEKFQKKKLFGSKEVSVYTIALNPNNQNRRLKSHEGFLLNWLISNIGNGTSVTLDEIKAYVKIRSQALKFKKDYDKWISLVKEEANRNDFFDTTGKTGVIIGILSGIGFLIAGAVVTITLYTPFAVIPAIMGVVLTIFSVRIKRRTVYGNEQYAMWEAFKNFLKDFSRLDKAEIPSIIIWEHYLVYAISLGVAKDVIKQLPLVFTDEDLNNYSLTYMYGANFGYFAGFQDMFDDTIHTVEGAITEAVNIANSQDSSSSGSGGGFSGGSSGGGGGGGGGGAF